MGRILKTVAIVQARMGSMRFPQKVMQPVCGTPLIGLLLERLSLARRIDAIVLATSDDPRNEPLARYVRELGHAVYRGSEHDVLDRYYRAAQEAGADVVVRITGDCPLVDAAIVDAVIGKFFDSRADYAANVLPPTFPDGLDVEVFSMEALRTAWKQATSATDREHVTPFIRNSDAFSRVGHAHSADESGERWTVDEPPDLRVVEHVFSHFHPRRDFGWLEVLALREQHPEWFAANRHLIRNEGTHMGTGQKLWKRAKRVIPGGNMLLSKRAEMFLPEQWPAYFSRAKGCRVWDLDGKEYIDLCCSHGATLLGHGDPRVTAAVQEALALGAPCSYESEQHAELAELLCKTIPSYERVRFTGSGTEAVMHTLRLARAYTGRTKILKIEGNFHGYHDQMMFSIGAPADRLGAEEAPAAWPASSGLPAGLAEQLILVPYNRTDLLAAAIERHAGELAAVICEPIYYNAGCVLPEPEFLTTMRTLTERHGIVLVFDEVLCAFRMGLGGAQEHLGITPDLSTVGKAVGGGYPLSVFGGKREIMERLMPQGDCQHSGTYNGHPVVVAAALAAIRAYREPGFYQHIAAVGERLFTGLNRIFRERGIAAHVQGLGARFGV
jgi:glutamate-1-semialdehyde 2,1-aminomutase